MTTRWLSFTVAVLIFLTAIGCSGNGIPLAPDTESNPVPGHSGAGKSAMIGLYQVVVDKETSNVEIYTMRTADGTLNVLGFMEPPALVNMTIDFNTLEINSEESSILVDVILTHPFVTQNHDFTGFDVRGVVYGPDILNADACSPLMNPGDFASAPFGYSDGLLGAPYLTADYDEDYWGYKYFADGIGLNENLVDYYSDPDNLANRGRFSEGANISRHYELDWDGTDYNFFVFNYSIVASYDWPVGDPPYDLDSFGITTANMSEAFCVTAYEVSNGLYYDGETGGGAVDIDVEVWDWQGLDNTEIMIESIEAGILGPAIVDTFDPGSTTQSGIFHFVGVEGEPVTTGMLDLRITVTDESETYGTSWFLDLLPSSNDFFNEYVYTVQHFAVEVSAGEPEIELYWYPVTGQTGIAIPTQPNQGARDPDLGVYSSAANQSRGMTADQTGNSFPLWNDGYTGLSDSVSWWYGSIMKDFNHFDISIDGAYMQLITHNQVANFPPNPDTGFAAVLSTATEYLPPFDGTDHLVWTMEGFDPTAYWLDLADASGGVVGHDSSTNGQDNNMYFIGSYSTASGQPGPHDGMYQFFRWLSPYYNGVTLFLDQIGVYSISTQTPGTPGPIDDTDAREHRLGVDDNSGIYFTTHAETDYAEFFYIIDNQNWLHMSIIEFDDPIDFIYIAAATEDNWGGQLVDVEVAPAFTGTEWSPYGWSCVLIDKGNNTWTVQTLLWDVMATELAVYVLDETDPLPGTALSLDVDNTDFELHVLARNGSTVEATVFKWYDNIPID
jgi:hypothetical protein